ncbi:hypothetical protein [Ammoniphilus sp. CFH 90114]|uniref:hypothetical protein n=1 Tax=Ammoniphilus sp. CFH 90114 TaxID=2493665 RepID=UPI0013E97D35|nr:hypothetical protein [Ammoniphilus sp. CFH 90114]
MNKIFKELNIRGSETYVLTIKRPNTPDVELIKDSQLQLNFWDLEQESNEDV